MPFNRTDVPGELKDQVVGTDAYDRGPKLADVCHDVANKLEHAGLIYGEDHYDFVRTFIVSLATRRFVILSGLSGAGKTRIAIALGHWFGNGRLHVEAVRPDWDNPNALLGFEDINSDTEDARHIWSVPRVLEFIMQASRDSSNPYLLVLDEMNLAHVEQYFADVLSGMESGEPVVPNLKHTGGFWRMPTEGARFVSWPKNLFLVGTINVDETTYLFSPKVLDRANTIEFRVNTKALRGSRTTPTRVAPGKPNLVKTFLQRSTGDDPRWPQNEVFADAMETLHEVLGRHDAEFGFRIFRDAARFGSLMADAGAPDFRTALDQVIVQKVLPKFDVDTREFSEALVAMAVFAFPDLGKSGNIDIFHPPAGEPALPYTFAKVQRMCRRLQRLGLARFTA